MIGLTPCPTDHTDHMFKCNEWLQGYVSLFAHHSFKKGNEKIITQNNNFDDIHHWGGNHFERCKKI